MSKYRKNKLDETYMSYSFDKMKNYNFNSSRNKFKGENNNYNNYNNFSYYNYYYNNNLSYHKKKNKYGKNTYDNEYSKPKDKNKNSFVSICKKYDSKKVDDQLDSLKNEKKDSIFEEVDKVNNITFGYDNNSKCDFSCMNNNIIENEKKLFKLNKLEKTTDSPKYIEIEEKSIIDTKEFIKREDEKRNIIGLDNENKSNYKSEIIDKVNDDFFQFDNKMSNITKFINKNIFFNNENDELNEEYLSTNFDPFHFIGTSNNGQISKEDKELKINKNITEQKTKEKKMKKEKEEKKINLKKEKNNYKKKTENEEENEEENEKKNEEKKKIKLDEYRKNKHEFTKVCLNKDEKRDNIPYDDNYENIHNYTDISNKISINIDNKSIKREKIISSEENNSLRDNILSDDINMDAIPININELINAKKIYDSSDLNKFKNVNDGSNTNIINSLKKLDMLNSFHLNNMNNDEDYSGLPNKINNLLNIYKLNKNQINDDFFLNMNENNDLNYFKDNYNLKNTENNDVKNIMRKYNDKYNESFLLDEKTSNQNDLSKLNENIYKQEKNKTNDVSNRKFNSEMPIDKNIVDVNNYVLKNHIKDGNYNMNVNNKLNNYKENKSLYMKDNVDIKLDTISDPNVLKLINYYYKSNELNDILTVEKNKNVFLNKELLLKKENDLIGNTNKYSSNNNYENSNIGDFYYNNERNNSDICIDSYNNLRINYNNNNINYDNNNNKNNNINNNNMSDNNISINNNVNSNNIYNSSNNDTNTNLNNRNNDTNTNLNNSNNDTNTNLNNSNNDNNNNNNDNNDNNENSNNNDNNDNNNNDKFYIKNNYYNRCNNNYDNNNFKNKSYINIHNINEKNNRIMSNTYSEKFEQKNNFYKNSDNKLKNSKPYSVNIIPNDKIHNHNNKNINNNDLHNTLNDEKITNENYIVKLKEHYMLKLTNLMKTNYKNTNINDLNDDMYNYYRFINKINANIKQNNYHNKYKNLMQKSEKDKLLRIQLSYMIINPSIQKNSGKWNFKNEEKDKEVNSLKYEKSLNTDNIKFNNIKNNNNEEKEHIDKNVFREQNKYDKFLNLYKNENNEIKSDDISLIESIKKSQNLNEDFSIYMNGKEKKLYDLLDQKHFDLNENIFDINIGKLLTFSLSDRNLIDEENNKNEKNNLYIEKENISIKKNDNDELENHEKEGDSLEKKVTDKYDTDDFNMHNDEYINNFYIHKNDICKYENIKKLGKYVFATVHEPRNLITLIKNKDFDNYDEIIDKIKAIIKNEINEIQNKKNCEVENNENEIKNEIKIYSKINNSNLNDNVIKKMLEILWDIYIDIKNLFKDIDKCPYTHIETISKYKEEIKKKKNSLFNFIFLSKLNNGMLSLNSFIDYNNIFTKRNISNLDIIVNKYTYLFLRDSLYNNLNNKLFFRYPDILYLINNLNFNKDIETKDITNSNEKIPSDKNNNMQNIHVNFYINRKNEYKNNISNIFLYQFPYENNLYKLHNYTIFGKILIYNNKYNYFNFENYNNYDNFLKTFRENENKSYFINEKENKKVSNRNSVDGISSEDIKTHNEIKTFNIDKNLINEELSRLKSLYFLFFNSFLKNKGVSIYKKIFKIIKKKKRKSLIYTLFSNYFLMYYIFSFADECFDSKVEYEEFLKLQLLHINSNINTLNKFLKNEKNQNRNINEKYISKNLNPPSNIRYKLYNHNIYTSLYIYLIDISLSYLFTPDIGISYIQDILSLLLFYNYIYLYITKILFYRSGAALITILLVKIIPYVKDFDRNLMICFLYSVLHSIFYILCNLFIYHLENEKKNFKGNEVELYLKIFQSMTNEIEFYKIIYKSICSYSHLDTYYEKEILYMLEDIGKDNVVKLIMNHIQK
ncbi:conserved Plasmodium membrane protein, unknown function [Plasmodium gallinaceum]|uniref:Uncharacterized protein n=1 Tax=Plasmodium gallinaceum TaxID=5849 RepID=A0A1J1GT71_PLAGA|nr:conserved Plasmodium membrane protein, unknown function [Plasmodium gallinaceum]CRG95708.1 conserved Plasmodium membrane protein, unknown function [Plasmodium gallinaceum]